MRSVLLSTVAALGLFAGVNLAAAQNAPDPRKDSPSAESRKPADEKGAVEKSKAAQEKAAPAKEQDKSKAAQEKAQPVKEKAAQEIDKKPQPAEGKAAQEKAQPAKEKAAEQAKPVENKAANEKAANEKATNDKAAQDKAKPAADKPAQEKAADQAKPGENKAAQDKAAQDKAAQDKAAQDKSNPAKNTTASEPARAGSDKSAATVAPEKQAKISEVLAKEKVEPVTNVNFSISIGTSVPERVRARRLPDEIVVVVPEYRGYDYIVVEDDIVIIEPRTRKIVVTIPRHGGTHTVGAATTTTTTITLSPDQRKTLHEIVLRENVRPVDAKMEIVVGRELPRTVEVHKFSDRVYGDMPELRSYEYFVKESQVVLVRDKKIVEIID
jgi:hypothetical protein